MENRNRNKSSLKNEFNYHNNYPASKSFQFSLNKVKIWFANMSTSHDHIMINFWSKFCRTRFWLLHLFPLLILVDVEINIQTRAPLTVSVYVCVVWAKNEDCTWNYELGYSEKRGWYHSCKKHLSWFGLILSTIVTLSRELCRAFEKTTEDSCHKHSLLGNISE